MKRHQIDVMSPEWNAGFDAGARQQLRAVVAALAALAISRAKRASEEEIATLRTACSAFASTDHLKAHDLTESAQERNEL